MNAVDKLLRAHGTVVGRSLIGLLFVFSGVGILMSGTAGVAGMIASKGLPLAVALAWIVVLIKIVAGAALIVGYETRWAALALLIFTLLSTLFFHMNLEDINLFKNLAIIGGLLYIYVYGPGAGWRLRLGESKPSSSSTPAI